MANNIILKKSSVAAKVPLTTDLEYGELALNYTDEKIYFKNVSNVIRAFEITGSVPAPGSFGNLLTSDGTSWVSSPGAQRVENTFTATAGQTNFTASSGYVSGYIDVYHNGVKLSNGTEFTASNGTTVVLSSGATVGDTVVLLSYIPRSIADVLSINDADARYLTKANPSLTGNLTFTGTGNRITGDFSNATQNNRIAFQTSTTNGNTTVNVIPNGTGTTSQFIAFNSTDLDNSSRAGFNTTTTAALFFADKTGTGTFLPMTFYTGGSERVRIDTSGNVIVGSTGLVWDEILSVRPSGAATVGVGVYTSSASYTGSLVRVQSETAGGTGWKMFEGRAAGGTQNFWIDGAGSGYFAGNVGIGINNPTVPFQIASSLTVAAGQPSFVIQGANNTERIAIRTTSDAVFITQKYRNTIDSPTAVQSGDAIGGFQHGGYAATTWGRGTQMQGLAADNWSDTSTPAHIVFQTVPTSSLTLTERMRIASDGNVQIGAESVNTLRYLDISNPNAGASAGSIIRFVTSNVAGSGNTTVDVVKYKTGGFYINNNETNAAAFTAFQVGASERMRIHSSGGVSIGNTTDPGATNLSVSGTIVNPTFKGYKETVVSVGNVSTSTYNLDLSLGNIFDVTLVTNVTFTFTNVPSSGTAVNATIIVRQPAASASKTATFTNAKYTEGVAPVLSTSVNQVDVLTFFTLNGGTFWFGTFAMANVF